MTFSRFALLAALAAMPFAATAQPASPPAPHTTPNDAFVYQPASEVQALTHRTDGKPQSKIVIDHENYFIEYVTRVINTNAEAHNHWYDCRPERPDCAHARRAPAGNMRNQHEARNL